MCVGQLSQHGRCLSYDGSGASSNALQIQAGTSITDNSGPDTIETLVQNYSPGSSAALTTPAAAAVQENWRVYLVPVLIAALVIGFYLYRRKK